MAALTATKVTKRLPVGDRVLQTFEVTTNATGGNAAEYITTGLSVVEAVVGSAVLGTASAALNFVLNAEGTGQTAGSTEGALGVESAGSSTVVQVTVLGLP